MTLPSQAETTAQAIPSDKLIETPESVHAKSVLLAEQIETHCRQTNEQYHGMIVIPRGAYAVANVLSREFGFTATNILHMAIGSYAAGSTERNATFEVGQMPTREQVQDKNWLIVDEVCDTGETLHFAQTELMALGANAIRSAVLHYKPTRTTTGYQPDFYVVETEKWVVYPGESSEARSQHSAVRFREGP